MELEQGNKATEPGEWARLSEPAEERKTAKDLECQAEEPRHVFVYSFAF